MNSAVDWFLAESAGAPEALRQRAAQYLAGPVSGAEAPTVLADAAAAALRDTLAHSGDRSIALNLLAADALVTLALLAIAQRHPGRLAEFAGQLRAAGAAIR